MAQIKVKPLHQELIVFDALSRRIPYKPEGYLVEKTPFIKRLINEGDLIVIPTVVAKAPKKAGN